jgi:hypothetical protein
LILIFCRRERAIRAGGLWRGTPGIRGAGRAASATQGGGPDLVAQPLSAQALSKLLDRKPHLLRPLAEQLLPPPLTGIDPAARLGIDLSSLRTAEGVRQVLSGVLMAIAHGDITPDEGANIAERVYARLRAGRRLARLRRRPSSARLFGRAVRGEFLAGQSD